MSERIFKVIYGLHKAAMDLEGEASAVSTEIRHWFIGLVLILDVRRQ
jgi:hypothetical protein